MRCSWEIPCAYGLAHLLERSHVAGQRLAIGKLVGAIGALGVEKIEKTSGSPLVGIVGDVTGLLGLIDVATLIELNDFIVGSQRAPGVEDVGVDLLGGFGRLFFGLHDREAGLGDFALVSIENRKIDVEEK